MTRRGEYAGPDRLEVGPVFSRRLHDLAREHDPQARQITCTRTLGPLTVGELPVVLSLSVPPDQCHLYRGGRKVAAYTLTPVNPLTRVTRAP